MGKGFFRHAADDFVLGYSNTFEGLSNGFVFGAGGSGLITPRIGISPLQSGSTTPTRANRLNGVSGDLSQQSLEMAFDHSQHENTIPIST